jgi:hypothetical protein
MGHRHEHVRIQDRFRAEENRAGAMPTTVLKQGR